MYKIFVTIVRDETAQSLRVMDVPGYSHMSKVFDLQCGKCRYAFIKGTNRIVVAYNVKKALGDAFWPSINFVDPYDPTWHRHDK